MDETFAQANRVPFGRPRILRTVGTFFREAHFAEKWNNKMENGPEKIVFSRKEGVVSRGLRSMQRND
jgi:hypothetical protein